MKTTILALAATGLLSGTALAQTPTGMMGTLRPDQQDFRGLYKELVETNTTVTNGSCTDAAAKMGARLEAAGFADGAITYFSTPEHPKDGGLVAVYPGTSKSLKPMLLLAHIDVVEAKRADWTRDPFTLIEENGYFYGRGTLDDKAQAAIWTDALIRMKQSGYKPKRTIKLALTCGEETSGAFNGAEWLAQNRPELVKADFGLNEGGGGRLDERGERQALSVQMGQKVYQDYVLTATNPGGHSSRPRPDNAIYELADALEKIRAYAFPVTLTETTRAALAPRAQQDDPAGRALRRLLADPADAEAARAAMTDVGINSVLHTTCVPTLLSAGHAPNALPQRATANVNCRIMPGGSPAAVREVLVKVIDDPKITVEAPNADKPVALDPPMDPKVIGPMRKLAARHFPGVPLVPAMSSGATDGIYFGGLGMPIYGVPGIFGEPDGNGAHGLNERLRARSLYEGRDYLFELVKAYVGAR
jgi:acetylornithine deacetylase/succinyl-diaminopimelate desuccinylase-like protein